MRSIILAVVIAAASSGPGGTAHAQPAIADKTSGKAGGDTSLLAYRRDIDAASAASGSHRYQDACRLFAPLAADGRAAALPVEQRRALLGAAGLAMWHCDRLPEAADLLRRATAEAMVLDDVFRLSLVEYRLGRHASALDAYLEGIARWPELADERDSQHVWDLYRAFAGQPDMQLRLLQAMFDARFDDPVEDNTSMWFELARLHLDRGDVGQARAAVRRVTDVRAIVRMRTDRRFDAAMDRSTHAFDVARQARNAVDRMQVKAQARPYDLAPWTHLTSAMLVAGDHDAAIATATRVLEASAGAGAGNRKGAAYRNLQHRAWLLNNRAIAHQRAGRTDAAIADLRRAIELDAARGGNVSQTLNLGALLCDSGRHREAVELVAEVPGISSYGQLMQASTRLCAADQRGDRREVRRQLAVYRTHGEAFPHVLLEGLLRAGELDEAERLYLRLLRDPGERADALLFAQTDRTAPPLPGARSYHAARVALLARPAVQAAIDAVGRVERAEVFLGSGFE